METPETTPKPRPRIIVAMPNVIRPSAGMAHYSGKSSPSVFADFDYTSFAPEPFVDEDTE